MTHKFAVGDLVRVSKHVLTEEGWDNVWVNKMNHALGYVFKVYAVDAETGIELALHNKFPHLYPDDQTVFDWIDSACDYRFPPSALSLVSQAVTEEI